MLLVALILAKKYTQNTCVEIAIVQNIYFKAPPTPDEADLLN